MSDDARHEDKTRNAGAVRTGRRSRWTLTAGLAAAIVVLLLAGNIAAPYLFAGATLEGAVAEQLRATAGLQFHARISGRFDLLPRPHLVFYETRVADPSGAIDIGAEEIDGDVRLLPLIVGRIELTSITLIGPRMTIDLDGKPIPADSFIGRAMRSSEPRPDQPLGVVTLVNGTTIVKSKAFQKSVELRDVNVTLDWRDLDSAATLTGTVSLRNTNAEVAAWIARPSSLMRGGNSAVAFHFHSAPLDASATGDLVSAATTAFNGHLSASGPSAAALLGLADRRVALPASFANLSINGDATFGIDTDGGTSLDLQKVTLRADGNAYEGSLAFQGGAGRPSLSGTLAAEQLMLAPFLSRLPSLRDSAGNWSPERLFLTEPVPLDLDLRVSANHVRLAPFTVDDAALGIMTRGDRTEVALVEGKAYGGTAKGRMSFGVVGEDVSLRAAGSLTGADASALTWDGFGRQVVGGSLSASANLETSGDSLAALMQHLQGWAKGSVSDGELTGIDLPRALQESQSGNGGNVLIALHSGRTPFQTLVFGLRAVDGFVSFDEGTIVTAAALVKATGGAELGPRQLDLGVVVTSLGAAAAPGKAPQPLAFRVKGPFDKTTVRPPTDPR